MSDVITVPSHMKKGSPKAALKAQSVSGNIAGNLLLQRFHEHGRCSQICLNTHG